MDLQRLTLPNTIDEPPGSWVYHESTPGGRHEIKGGSFDMLLAAVNRWKASQGVAQVSAAQLKDWICQRNAGHGCIPTNEQFEQLTVTGRQSVAKAGCSSGCGEAHEVR